MNTEERKRFNQLVSYLRRAKSEAELAAALQALLTPAELHDIPNRLMITQLLRKGLTQREIAKQLGVGIATVTRGSKALNEMQNAQGAHNDDSQAE